MSRVLFALIAVGLIAGATGCTMCAHPYDYCGPTFMGGCGEQCDPDYVAGSILSGAPTAAQGEETIVSEELMPVPEEEYGPRLLEPQEDLTSIPASQWRNRKRGQSLYR
ncbi:MAG: hypothetical protein JW818_04455 [Pirellulales bacterium]|nr:hypothetical protein [Pirellulales bacterium]